MLQARERYRAAVIMISTMASADMRREPTTVVLTPGASIYFLQDPRHRVVPTDVSHEHRGLHHIRKTHPCGGQCGSQVFEGLSGLDLDVAGSVTPRTTAQHPR